MTANGRTVRHSPVVLGVSPQMRKIADTVAQVGPTDITVLITGESGTGKEVVAKAIHAASHRSRKPMITVNSGAIPEGIIESELFGHERGSFTGASEQRKGYFELADGGTIFLDEVGELPLAAQVKFLRVLENGEFLRVGSSHSRTVDVRVIAATNKNLDDEVRAGRFRADLLFRLRTVTITIPPLRERVEDIPALLEYFAADVARRNGLTFEGITDEGMQVLSSYSWPGNVRELRNVTESMLVLEKGKRLDAADVRRYLNAAPHGSAHAERLLPVPVHRSVEEAERELILRALLEIKGDLLALKNLFAERLRPAAADPGEDDADRMQELRMMSLQDMERTMIAQALERFKGNRRVAARALNISERTLYRKIKEYGLS